MKIYQDMQIELVPEAYPPSDDTFLMISALNPRLGQSVLEMGTGSGIIAMHCARAGARVTAADISPESLECARHNAHINGLEIEFAESDMFSNIKGKYDLIIFNPPYLSALESDVLAVDDKRQLVGGEVGHEISIQFLEDAAGFLSENGRIYLLTSTETSGPVLTRARQLYLFEKIAEQRMFFEVLSVYELKLDKN